MTFSFQSKITKAKLEKNKIFRAKSTNTFVQLTFRLFVIREQDAFSVDWIELSFLRLCDEFLLKIGPVAQVGIVVTM